MRIRTVKPEWLEDDRLLEAGSDARVLSIALILLSDDHGRGRLNRATAARVFPCDPLAFDGALADLTPWFVQPYEVRGQKYFEICNWTKHQKVDRPSKPRVPEPAESETLDASPRDTRETVASPSRDTREGSASRLGNIHSRDTRETLASDLDLDPDLDHDHERARERPSGILSGFQRRFEAARKAIWPGTSGNPKAVLEKWVAAQAELESLSFEAVLEQLLDNYFADPWAQSIGFSWAGLVKDPARFYRPPEKQRQTGERIVA